MTEPGNFSRYPEDLAKRRVPCLIAYLKPFRVVGSKKHKAWEATIEQVNKHSWDYVALHEMIGGLNVELQPPYHMVVARDGALALPRVEGLMTHQDAVEFYNRCLAALLIGGIYCEAITPDGLDLGCIIDWKYVRSFVQGQAGDNRFHFHIRFQSASSLEAIALLRPRVIAIENMMAAMATGLGVLRQIPPLRGEYLLKGTTGIARREWGAALSNLWIVCEQVLSLLWTREIVGPTLSVDASRPRRDQLNDHRTWTAAARIETLFQKGVIPQKTVVELSRARKARNDLAHSGEHPSEVDALSAYRGVCDLIGISLGGKHFPLLDLDLANHSLSDPFVPPQGELKPEYWMDIPKLPGEAELEKAEAAWDKKQVGRRPGAAASSSRQRKRPARSTRSRVSR